jgi:hypothetical protein
MLDNLAKKGLSVSIIVGTLLVPLTALAAIWLTDTDQAAEETSAPTTTALVTNDIAADLQTACGPEGMQLVSLEESASITNVQQAALDALREVCQQQGIPLPSKPVADPIVKTVVVPATIAASPVPSSTPTTLHDDHESEDDEYEDDRDEHEDEEHEEDD